MGAGVVVDADVVEFSIKESRAIARLSDVPLLIKFTKISACRFFNDQFTIYVSFKSTTIIREREMIPNASKKASMSQTMLHIRTRPNSECNCAIWFSGSWKTN